MVGEEKVDSLGYRKIISMCVHMLLLSVVNAASNRCSSSARRDSKRSTDLLVCGWVRVRVWVRGPAGGQMRRGTGWRTYVHAPNTRHNLYVYTCVAHVGHRHVRTHAHTHRHTPQRERETEHTHIHTQVHTY